MLTTLPPSCAVVTKSRKLTSWKPLGLFRPVMGLIYLLLSCVKLGLKWTHKQLLKYVKVIFRNMKWGDEEKVCNNTENKITFKGVSSNDSAIGPIMVIRDGLYFNVVRMSGPKELLEKLNRNTGYQKLRHTFHVSVFRIMQFQLLSVTHVYENVFTVRRRLINLAMTCALTCLYFASTVIVVWFTIQIL